ncbi:hypothetical protein BGX26_001710 [Mortierella sp. AD094]|nr:hypothetical protein BGX26_001710 [Mortierella sp. AD094]
MSTTIQSTKASADSHLQWAKSKHEGEEHVTLPNFVARFKHFDKESAYSAYSDIIRCTQLSRKRRKRLCVAFDAFKSQQEEEFWANLEAKICADETTELDDDSLDSDEETIAAEDPIGLVKESEQAEDFEEAEDVEELLQTSSVTPFHELVQYIYRKVQRKQAIMPGTPAGLSKNHKELYIYAQDILARDNAPGVKGSKAQAFVLSKDVLVLLSGIVNAISAEALNKILVAPTIKRDSLLPSFNIKEESVKDLLHEMLVELCPGYENDEGELSSPSTKKARMAVESVFGATTKYICGRKVDISLRVLENYNWDTEISIFEFKPPDVTPSTREKQQRKAVRLNTAVLLDLEKKGVDIAQHFPVIAEGLGLALNFYTLRRYDDVIGAGKATAKTVWLPCDEISLKEWLLSDSVHVLLAFTKHTMRFATEVKQSMARAMAGPIPTTPPQTHRPLPPAVLLSPSRRNKRLRPDDDDSDDENDDIS